MRLPPLHPIVVFTLNIVGVALLILSVAYALSAGLPPLRGEFPARSSGANPLVPPTQPPAAPNPPPGNPPPATPTPVAQNAQNNAQNNAPAPRPPVVATAVALSTLPPGDRKFFDDANAKSSNADSARLDLNMAFTASLAGQTLGQMTVRGSGFAMAGKDPFRGQLDLEFVISAQGEQRQANLALRVVDSVLYMKVSGQGAPDQWQSLPINDLTRLLSEVSLPLPDPATGQGFPGFDLGLFDRLSPEQIERLVGILDFTRYFETVRLADSGDFAVFATNIYPLQFLQSPEVAALMAGLMGLMGDPQTNPDVDQARNLIQAAPDLIQQFIEKLDIRVEHTVNKRDLWVTRITLRIDSGFKVAVTDAQNTPVPATLGLAIDGALNLSGYGGIYTVEKPANATPLVVGTP